MLLVQKISRVRFTMDGDGGEIVSCSENEDNDETESSGKSGYITFVMLQTAYKFFMNKQTGAETNDYDPLQFVLPDNAKDTYRHPLLKIYRAVQKPIILDVPIPITIKQLCLKILKLGGAHYECRHRLYEKLRRSNKNQDNNLCRKLIIIYYNIVFDESFRKMVHSMFDHNYNDKNILSVDGDGARVTNATMMYRGNSCIECNGKLDIVYRSSNKSKGSLAIAYHKREAPKLCASYQKRCNKCNIRYNYNRIDYGSDAEPAHKRGNVVLLDPDAFPYYSIAGKSTRNYIHKSMHSSIANHQFCKKSTSISIWLQHYNEEFIDEFDELSKINNINEILPSIKLGYIAILRYFYLVCLLRRIRDIENYKPITINGQEVKVALIITNADKMKMDEELHALSDIKNDITTNDTKTNKSNKNDKTTNDKARDKDASTRAQQYFGYFVRKYYDQLISATVDELRDVPVKLNTEGVVLIYPGWFIVYGDGGEKINRLRCAYPAILAKLDYILHTMNTAGNDEDIKINDIQKDDDDIDLNVNNDARKYSAQRYYECEESPYYNDPDNKKKSYKCCKHHIAKLIKHGKNHGIKLDDIRLFIHWYQINAALAKMKNTDVKKTIKATYTIDEDALNNIKTKHAKKINELECEAHQFIKKNPEKAKKFEKFVDHIHSEVNKHKLRTHYDRKCKTRAKANATANAVSDEKQALYDKLRNILGDEDFDVADIDEMIDEQQTSVIDLLNLEFNYNKYLDKYAGCRKSKNISGATTSRTKGLNVLMNCAGIIIRLREEIVRETPTAVILDIAKSCTNDKTSIEYANRIEAIGYDMICRMYYHLKALIKKKRLPAIQEQFWCELVWRAFVDIWHIFTHTDELCQKTGGVFHPRLPKFEEITYHINLLMQNVNDMIAEQFWSTMNATHQLKSMSRERFTLFLIEKRAYHNKAKVEEIKDDGWTFVPIEHFKQLRSLKKRPASPVKLPTKAELKDKSSIPLSKVVVKPDHMQAVAKLIKKANGKRSTPRKSKRKLNTSTRTPTSTPKRKKRKTCP